MSFKKILGIGIWEARKLSSADRLRQFVVSKMGGKETDEVQPWQAQILSSQIYRIIERLQQMQHLVNRAWALMEKRLDDIKSRLVNAKSQGERDSIRREIIDPALESIRRLDDHNLMDDLADALRAL